MVDLRVRKHLLPTLGKLPITAIDLKAVEDTIRTINGGKSPVAMRTRLDLEAILDWATAKQFRSGDNPASWKGPISLVLPNVEKIREVKPFESLPHQQIGTFMARLRDSRHDDEQGATWRADAQKWQARITARNGKRISLGFFSNKEDAAAAYRDAAFRLHGGAFVSAGKEHKMSAALLEFIILTVVRSGQAAAALGRHRLGKKIWTCKRHKTAKKAKRPHLVVLSEQAIAVLKRMQATQAADGNVSEHVFVLGQAEASAGGGHGQRGNPATEFTAIAFLAKFRRRYPEYKGITVHGFRKTFSSWANDEDRYSHETIEMTLAHRIGDKTADIYNQLAKRENPRRLLMAAWANRCGRSDEPLDAKIIPMRTATSEKEKQ